MRLTRLLIGLGLGGLVFFGVFQSLEADSIGWESDSVMRSSSTIPYDMGTRGNPHGSLAATASYTLYLPLISSRPGGLIAYYPFNGNANDESGNGNHGIVYGATLAADRNGNADSAIALTE